MPRTIGRKRPPKVIYTCESSTFENLMNVSILSPRKVDTNSCTQKFAIHFRRF